MKKIQVRIRSTQRKKKTKARRSHRGAKSVPRTAKQFFARSPAFQNTWTAVTQVISKMRADSMSLRDASREFDLDPHVAARFGKSALRKRANGQYVAKRVDNLLRILAVPIPNGVGEVAIRDSRQASQLGKYWSALQKYLQTGDASALVKFRRTRITDASGKRVPLITDLAELDRLGSAGVLSFESLYSRVG